MKTQREKLIELIIESVKGCARHWAELIADYLLANGIVVLPCNAAVVWHKVTTRPLTAEEKSYYAEMGMEHIEYIFDCEMPEDMQEILVATEWGTDKDICSNDADYGIGLEGRGDWDGVYAWAEMPQYKENNDENTQ